MLRFDGELFFEAAHSFLWAIEVAHVVAALNGSLCQAVSVLCENKGVGTTKPTHSLVFAEDPQSTRRPSLACIPRNR